ncbi:hypothetical protein OS493_038270 [Desmophyllum pertusum]|uniref:Uncharacterized protein n=1 Tax=Desmophyllum pertusum TaxID=174260 RepID=A0A9X0CJE4_9CNID|nr:hypothetical protein OS493_038270 [Desmophyllum pertusum]
MKITLAIFFCVILGVTTAYHVTEETEKGEDDLLQLEKTAYDDPDKMAQKMHDISEGLKILVACINGGGDKHKCFETFVNSVKPSPAERKCIVSLEGCVKAKDSNILDCLNKFKECVNRN